MVATLSFDPDRSAARPHLIETYLRISPSFTAKRGR